MANNISNLELRQEHFSKNLPLFPIDFATLEIESSESARGNLAGVFHFTDRRVSIPGSKPFDWTTLATSIVQ